MSTHASHRRFRAETFGAGSREWTSTEVVDVDTLYFDDFTVLANGDVAFLPYDSSQSSVPSQVARVRLCP
jgi:hypothetical protein